VCRSRISLTGVTFLDITAKVCPFVYAGCTLCNATCSPCPHLSNRLSVYHTTIASHALPCVNHVEEVLIFGQFLFPEQGLCISHNHTFPIRWSFRV
jgi:hypothetical protein